MNAIFAVVIAAALAWCFSDLVPLGSEVTVYNITCMEGLKNGVCGSIEKTVTPVTYEAIAEQQNVVYWLGRNGTPQRLQRCIVRDARNWSCNLDDKAGTELKMANGQIKDDADHAAYAVSKLYWWWVRVRE
jgi:hypothetical protein